jgi:hypothetical protein
MQISYNLLKISYLQTGKTAVKYQSSTAQDKKSTTMLITNNWNTSKHYMQYKNYRYLSRRNFTVTHAGNHVLNLRKKGG